MCVQTATPSSFFLLTFIPSRVSFDRSRVNVHFDERGVSSFRDSLDFEFDLDVS